MREYAFAYFQHILGCSGNCSSAIEDRERVCSSNSNCLLLLSYPCFDKSICADGCTGNCSGEWVPSGKVLCPVFCDGGTGTVQYSCRDQSKKNEKIH